MSTALVHSVSSSNMSDYSKSALGALIDQIKGGGRSTMAKIGVHGFATVNVVREYAEAGITGTILGAAHVMLPDGGLDLAIPGTQLEIPLDAAGAVVLGALAIWKPLDLGATDARSIGANMGAIWAFRKTYDFVAAKQKKAGGKVGGKFAGEGDDWSNQSSLGAETENQLLSAIAKL